MIYELSVEDLEQVEGGNILRLIYEAVKAEIIARLAAATADAGVEAGKVAGEWVIEKAPSGTDEAMWTRIGQSQMGS